MQDAELKKEAVSILLEVNQRLIEQLSQLTNPLTEGRPLASRLQLNLQQLAQWANPAKKGSPFHLSGVALQAPSEIPQLIPLYERLSILLEQIN